MCPANVIVIHFTANVRRAFSCFLILDSVCPGQYSRYTMEQPEVDPRFFNRSVDAEPIAVIDPELFDRCHAIAARVTRDCPRDRLMEAPLPEGTLAVSCFESTAGRIVLFTRESSDGRVSSLQVNENTGPSSDQVVGTIQGKDRLGFLTELRAATDADITEWSDLTAECEAKGAFRAIPRTFHIYQAA